MPYYTGVSNSYADLITALTNGCTANGWTWADGILSKGSLYVKVTETTSSGSSVAGVLIQGGTSKTGATLNGGAWIKPKMSTPNTLLSVTWPVEYYLHIYTNPDEVYLVVRYNVDRFMWLTFGQSNIPGLTGTGLWTSASQAERMVSTSISTTPEPTNWWRADYYNSAVGYHSTPGGSPGAVTCGGPFMAGDFNPQSSESSSNHTGYNSTIHTGYLTTAGGWTFYPWWGYSNGFADFGRFNGELITRSISVWSQESTLIPFSVYERRANSKVSLVMQPMASRFCNVANYEPGQTITLGADKWRVYPFGKKNSSVMTVNGQYSGQDTGRLGWAIRYDGP